MSKVGKRRRRGNELRDQAPPEPPANASAKLQLPRQGSRKDRRGQALRDGLRGS